MRVARRERGSGKRRASVRAQILVCGALVDIAIILAGLVVLGAVTNAQTDFHQAADNGLPVQAQLVALRTTLTQWQFFIEPEFDAVAPGVRTDPNRLAQGVQINATQSAQEAGLAKSLRRVGFSSDARDLDAATAAFEKAITKLTPIATGGPIAPAALRALIDAERHALENVWSVTGRASAHVLQDITSRAVEHGTDQLDLGRWLLLGVIALHLSIASGGALILSGQAGAQARDRRSAERRREYETSVQQALGMTKTETDVYGIVGTALHDSLPELNVELLIADSSHAHFRRALTSDAEFDGCGVISPLDCPATTGGQALVFPSSRALEACPHLKDRPSGPCSAACLPMSVAGRTIGVIHAVGRDGIPPPSAAVDTVKFTSGRGAERIAMIRAFETSETQAQTDPLTGLLNRRSLENQVSDLHREGIPYALAYGDLDHFKVLNDTHGHETGDRALRAFSRILRDCVRPNDIVARYGGEEFVVVLPDCDTGVAVGVLERVRENLALALNRGLLPPFTVTFGVASTAYAREFDAVVAIADGALLDAKTAGRNRVLVAEFPVTTIA